MILSIEVGLVERQWIIELLLFDLDHCWPLSVHLIQLLQQLLAVNSFALVELFYCLFYLMHRVQF